MIFDLVFVIKFAKLFWLWIHLMSMISRFLYDCRKFTTSIIRCFFCVMPSFIKHSYNDFELMQKISGTTVCIIFVKMPLMIAFKSNSCIISYNSTAKTLQMILLHFINNQWMMFVLLITFVKQITYSIFKKKFQLFVNKKFLNITNSKILQLNLIKISFFFELLNCHCKRLFNAIISSAISWIIWMTKNKSNEISN